MMREKLLQLLYETLPLEDLGSTSEDVLLSYVDHAVFLWETDADVRALPKGIFLHDVFYPRVGTEKLVDCRRFFYDLVKNITGTTREERILNINAWCMGEMTYQSADLRTQHPLTSFYSGSGRCGEESVFVVSVLRAAGIPARQVYVPYWSHCDDNHAWVEVYVNGTWQFLGACEYEPRLNLGWFNQASSRAMLVHSRTFFERKEGALISRVGKAYYYNETERYAHTGKLRLSFAENALKTEKKIKVMLYVVNYGALLPLAEMDVNPSEIKEISLGIGSIVLSASVDGKIVKRILEIRENTVTEVWLNVEESTPAVENFTFYAPAVRLKHPALRSEEEQQKKLRISEAAKAHLLRKEKILPETREDYQAFLNSSEVHRKFAACLTEKDGRDISVSLLEDFAAQAKNREHLPEDVFIPFVMNPRIHFEELTDYRTFIREEIPQEVLSEIKAAPETVTAFIDAHFPDAEDESYHELFMTPEAVLRMKRGSRYGKKLLSAAILRTLNIPARLNPESGELEYYKNGAFIPLVSEVKKCRLTVCFSEKEKRGQVTLQREAENRIEEAFREIRNGETVEVPYGTYVLLAAVRLPSGHQKVQCLNFTVETDALEKEISFPKISKKELLSSFSLPESIRAVLPEEKCLLMLLNPSEEPTEHVLTELRAAEETVKACLRSGLQVLVSFPEGRAVETGFSAADLSSNDAEDLARALFLEPGAYPFLVLTDRNQTAVYRSSGYNVGAVAQILSLQALL